MFKTKEGSPTVTSLSDFVADARHRENMISRYKEAVLGGLLKDSLRDSLRDLEPETDPCELTLLQDQKYRAATGLATGPGIPTAQPETVGLSSKRLNSLKMTLEGEVVNGNIAGVVIMIARNGKLVYSDEIGYQDKSSEKPLKKDAIFRIYSMTKPLTSVGMMTLVEDGKIQLTDPLSKYLPEFMKMEVSIAQTDAAGVVSYTTVPATRRITIQDLLRHTAGLVYAETAPNPVIKKAYIEAGVCAADGTEYDQGRITAQQQITAIANTPLSTHPGSTWEYGMSADILGRVIEVVSGVPLSVYLDERLFKPVKMVDTGFRVPGNDVHRIAEPLATDPVTGLPNKMIDVETEPANASGGAGGVSTASDYLRFAVMLLRGGEIDGQRILSPTTVRLMTADHIGSRLAALPGPGELLLGMPGYTFGLGFMTRQGAGIAGLSGSEGEYMWGGAAGTFFWVDPSLDMAVVVMMQSPGPSRPGYRRLIKQMVYAAVEK